MSFTLKVSSLALLDIEDAFFWYEYQKKGLGDEILKCLYEGLDYIISYPLHCEKKYKEVRVKFIRLFPFGIHYLVVGNEVRVVAFFHMRKDPKRWNKRLKGE